MLSDFARSLIDVPSLTSAPLVRRGVMRLLSRFGVAVVLLGMPLSFVSAPAVAQQAIQLPGIYVQGATLEAPRPARSAGEGTGATGPTETTAPNDVAVGGDTVGGVPAYT